jgi:NAD(P)-dependent dehydrogenase (short-subunit alcohol dehydrogenase family)
MPDRLAGKVAIVTGAGSGMGRAGAEAFAAEGAVVVVADIDEGKAERVVARITEMGGQAVARLVDVADSARVQHLVNGTVAEFDRVDVLYHCAADVPFINSQDRRLTDLAEEVWRRMLDVHLTGTFLCAKYAGLQMLRQRSGSIILTATVDALIGTAGLDSYTAAKGGIVALTRSFAAGVGNEGVRVNCICPGFVATESQMPWLADPASRAEIERLHILPIPEPEAIAPFAVYLASDESAFVTGGIFPIDSGYMAFKARLDVMGAIQKASHG